MNNGKYNIKELFSSNEVEQLIIPEIQRDYVWNEAYATQLCESIIAKAINKKENKLELSLPCGVQLSEAIREKLRFEYDQLINNTKIGFVYAYHDIEFRNKFFLIDGQQRLTTIYLFLLALHIASDNQVKFRKEYMFEGRAKLDYKVRESSHQFLQHLVDFVLKKDNVVPTEDLIRKQDFFFFHYKQDATVQNFLKNFIALYTLVVSQIGISPEELLSFVENNVEFNYFDTNLSSQGERLYLYMNSRGESLSVQELVKANLISDGVEDDCVKLERSEKWECWQDFFWKHKDNKNASSDADLGFEQFLRWVSLIKIFTSGHFTKDEKNAYLKETSGKDAETQKRMLYDYQLKNLKWSDVEQAFIALEWLEDTIFRENELLPESWLGTDLSNAHLIVLLPALLLAQNYKEEWGQKKEMLLDLFILMYLRIQNENVAKNVADNFPKAIALAGDIIDNCNENLLSYCLKSNEFSESRKLVIAFLQDQGEAAQQFIIGLKKSLIDKILNGELSILFEFSQREKQGEGFSYPLVSQYMDINLMSQYAGVIDDRWHDDGNDFYLAANCFCDSFTVGYGTFGFKAGTAQRRALLYATNHWQDRVFRFDLNNLENRDVAYRLFSYLLHTEGVNTMKDVVESRKGTVLASESRWLLFQNPGILLNAWHKVALSYDGTSNIMGFLRQTTVHPYDMTLCLIEKRLKEVDITSEYFEGENDRCPFLLINAPVEHLRVGLLYDASFGFYWQLDGDGLTPGQFRFGGSYEELVNNILEEVVKHCQPASPHE